MNPKNISRYSLFIGWALSAIAIVFIALIIVPVQSRSDHFLYRILWTEILCIFSWGSLLLYSFFFTKDDSQTRYGGITPTISVIVINYSILSFIAMVANSFIKSDIVNRIHLVFQIIIFVLAAIYIIFLSISREAAVSGQVFDRSKAITPIEVKNILSFCETSIQNPSYKDLKSNIKQLKETVQFSLNENTSLSNSPQYQEFCIEIQNLSDSISNLVKDKNGDTEKVNFLVDTAKSLTAKTKLIANKLIQR